MADLGYWSGSIVYSAPYGKVSVPLGSTDSSGVDWLLMKVEGWDGPDTAGQVIQRSADHGGWAASQYYAPRIITLTVLASAPDQATRDSARALFQQVIPVSDFATFTFNEPVPKQMLVRRSGRLAETYPTLTDVQFSCVLVAPDPRKYATVQNVTTTQATVALAGISLPFTLPATLTAQPLAGSVLVTNGGTFETRPVIVLTGPLSGPSITNATTGQTVSFSSLTLTASDQLVLDMDTRQAALNGQLRVADPVSSWWVLWPGSSTIQLGGNSTGGASMQVTWSNAYI